MSIEIRYASRGGNTQRVAQAIAGAVGVQALLVDRPVEAKTELLFLGGSVYAGGIDASLRSFIDTLSPEMVSKVAVFGTAAVKTSAYPQIKALLEAKQIKVLDREFHCRGQFAFVHRGRPNAEDLRQAEQFAREVVAQTQGQ